MAAKMMTMAEEEDEDILPHPPHLNNHPECKWRILPHYRVLTEEESEKQIREDQEEEDVERRELEEKRKEEEMEVERRC